MKNSIISVLVGTVLNLPLAVSAAGYKDQAGPDWASVKRSFKVSVDECKKSWEVSAESGISFCAVNSDPSGTVADGGAIVESDDIKFICSVKEKAINKKFNLEIVPHGTFGYLVQTEGQVLFASIESCLSDKIKSLPNAEISVTFVKSTAKK